MIKETSIWVVLPNAGLGTRLGSIIPKQYLSVHGKRIIEWTLELFSKIDFIDGIVIANNNNDEHWKDIKYTGNVPLVVVEGGSERFNSVLNACNGIRHYVKKDAWVLVHDVARPLVAIESIKELVDYCLDKNVAGILGHPVTDTIKTVIDNEIKGTVDRALLWQAQTPQFFPLNQLINSMTSALHHNLGLTDEASAFEHSGLPVHIVKSPKTNIKVTYSEDLDFIEFIKSYEN